jgi:tRNA modification GTPase
VRSLTGSFSKEVHALCERLIDLRMLVEATLDFPDEDVDFLIEAKAFERIEVVASELRAILDRARQGSLLRNGLHVVLVGQPNVGKSSLLNRLAGEERAIVTDIAGTTRDALRETIQIEGIPLHITDTAGLRDTTDEVEKIGIARTWQEIERADVVVRLVDVRAGLTAADADIDARLPAGVERITVFNKVDLADRAPERIETNIDGNSGVSLYLSAKAGQGVDLLRAELLRVAGWHRHGEDVILARERHLLALREALARVEAALEARQALELMAEELRLAQEAINSLTGEFTPDDLLGVIFSRFCIGK